MSKNFKLIPIRCPYNCIKDDKNNVYGSLELVNKLNEQNEQIKRLEALLYIFDFVDSNDTARDDVKDILELMNDYDFTWDDVYTILYAYIINIEKVM